MDLRVAALEQAVNYTSYRADRHTNPEVVLEVADKFYAWLNPKPAHATSVKMVFDPPTQQGA